MADIALISADITLNSATAVRDALVAHGHTVTLLTDADAIASHDFSGYDAVVTARTDGANRADLASLLNDLNEGGMPIVVGPLEVGGFGASTSTQSILTSMGLTGNIAIERDQTSVKVLGHILVGSIVPDDITLYSSNAHMASVAVGQSYLGSEFIQGNVGNVNSLPMALAIDPSTSRLTSGTTGARIVVFPTYIINNAYTADHSQLLENAVEWALTGAVTDVAPPNVQTSKLIGYSVLNFPEDNAAASKIVGYAVMDAMHEQVYTSKLVGYAVMVEGPYIPKVGDTLGYQNDTWENEPTSFEHQWKRDEVAIGENATSHQYTLVDADALTMISKSLRAFNAGGASEWVTSEAIGPIREAIRDLYNFHDTLTYDGAATTSLSWENVDIGPAHPDRLVMLSMAWWTNNSQENSRPISILVNGVLATWFASAASAQASTTFPAAGIAVVLVPEGENVDIEITLLNEGRHMGIGVYTTTRPDIVPYIPRSASAAVAGSTLISALDVFEKGFVLSSTFQSMTGTSNDINAVEWTGSDPVNIDNLDFHPLITSGRRPVGVSFATTEQESANLSVDFDNTSAYRSAAMAFFPLVSTIIIDQFPLSGLGLISGGNYFFSGRPVGKPAANRKIVIALGWSQITGRTLQSVKVAGVEATEILPIPGTSSKLFIVDCPEGYLADVQITLSGSVSSIQFHLWPVYVPEDYSIIYKGTVFESTVSQVSIIDLETVEDGFVLAWSYDGNIAHNPTGTFEEAEMVKSGERVNDSDTWVNSAFSYHEVTAAQAGVNKELSVSSGPGNNSDKRVSAVVWGPIPESGIEYTPLGAGANNTSTNSNTITGVSLGDEAEDRIIVIALAVNNNNTNARTVNSVTVTPSGGSPVSLTRLGRVSDVAMDTPTEIWAAFIPEGTTGDMTFNMSGTCNRWCWGRGRITGLNSLTPVSVERVLTLGASVDIEHPNQTLVLAAGGRRNNGGDTTITGTQMINDFANITGSSHCNLSFASGERQLARIYPTTLEVGSLEAGGSSGGLVVIALSNNSL